ncbi:hypothetical protein HDU81_000421 [Chytriomyces hyalinus]|nr:hypothetical protein HDU81_000421 [Chytriomyces hyalinus]
MAHLTLAAMSVQSRLALTAAAVVALLAAWTLRRSTGRSRKTKFPNTLTNWPIAGHLFLLRRPSLLYTRLSNNGTRAAANGTGGQLSPSWPKRWQKLLGPSSVAVESDQTKHKRLRVLLGQGISPDVLSQSVPQMRDSARTRIAELVKGSIRRPVDVYNSSKVFSYNAIVLFIFGGRECDVVIMNQQLENFVRWTNGLADFIIPEFLGGPYGMGMKAKKDIAIVLMDIFRSRRSGTGSQLAYKDGLEKLLEAKTESGQSLTDQDLVDNIVVLIFFAGNDTTAASIASCIHCFAYEMQPSEQTMLLDEIDGFQSDPTYQQLLNMPVLDAFVKEMLRFRPPIMHVPRQASEGSQVELEGIFLHPEARLSVALGALGYNTNVFESPDDFQIARFLDVAKGKKMEASCQYAPFGAGPRQCLGINLARLEVRLFVFELLKHYALLPSRKKATHVWFPVNYMMPYVTVTAR